MEFRAARDTFENELDIAKEADIIELKNAEFLGRK